MHQVWTLFRSQALLPSAFERMFWAPTRRPGTANVRKTGLNALHLEADGPPAAENQLDDTARILEAVCRKADGEERQDPFRIAIADIVRLRRKHAFKRQPGPYTRSH